MQIKIGNRKEDPVIEFDQTVEDIYKAAEKLTSATTAAKLIAAIAEAEEELASVNKSLTDGSK